jgi:hypothetical protein
MTFWELVSSSPLKQKGEGRKIIFPSPGVFTYDVEMSRMAYHDLIFVRSVINILPLQNS